MREGIAVCGNIFVDHVKMVDQFPHESMLANIRKESRCVGGCVSNTALTLARLNPALKVQAIGAVGNDEDGRFILDFYRHDNIDVSNIKVDATLSTGYTDVISSITGHTRTFFNSRGANVHFCPQDIPLEEMECEILHMGYALLLDRFDEEDAEYGTVLARTFREAQKQGIKTSIDVVSEDSDRFQRIVSHALPYCNYLIINETEAGLITGIAPRNQQGELDNQKMEEICSELLRLGVQEYVVLHSREGGFLMDVEHGFYTMPSLILPDEYIKGAVGAGDAFCAGILCGLNWQIAPKELLQLGIGAAAACLSAADSVSGIESIEQVYSLICQYSK